MHCMNSPLKRASWTVRQSRKHYKEGFFKYFFPLKQFCTQCHYTDLRLPSKLLDLRFYFLSGFTITMTHAQFKKQLWFLIWVISADIKSSISCLVRVLSLYGSQTVAVVLLGIDLHKGQLVANVSSKLTLMMEASVQLNIILMFKVTEDCQ